MTHASKLITTAVAAILFSSVAAFAQSGSTGGGATGGAAGTNSVGTANASGGSRVGGAGITTGASGTGQASPDGKPVTGDPQVDAQDRAVDRKVKSICKGC